MEKCSGYSNVLRRCRNTGALLLLLFASAPALHAQRSERDVKALFFVMLTRYTEWPENAFQAEDSPIVIGVIGDEDPFGRILDSLTRNETVRGRRLQVRRYSRIEEIQECHLLYFGEMSVVRRELELKKIARRPILTVSDAPGFARQGGAVELFINEEDKVRLRVSKDALSRANISISPSIMRLAETVAFIELLPPTAGSRPSITEAEIFARTANRASFGG